MLLSFKKRGFIFGLFTLLDICVQESFSLPFQLHLSLCHARDVGMRMTFRSSFISAHSSSFVRSDGPPTKLLILLSFPKSVRMSWFERKSWLFGSKLETIALILALRVLSNCTFTMLITYALSKQVCLHGNVKHNGFHTGLLDPWCERNS